MDILGNNTLILASKSPRRKDLLNSAHIPYVSKYIDVEESYPASLNAADVPTFLADKKAEALKDELKSDIIVLTADTIVIYRKKILEKPTDREEAQSMLKKLGGNSHKVITGVCLRNSEKKRVFSELSTVEFYDFSEEEINYYISKYNPYDKAGSYGIQDWIGICKIKSIKGSYSNIMGLPMGLLYQELVDFVK
jgi:septum formation protein